MTQGQRIALSVEALVAGGTFDEAKVAAAKRGVTAAREAAVVTGARVRRRPQNRDAARRHEAASRRELRAFAVFLDAVGLRGEATAYRGLADAPAASPEQFAAATKAGLTLIDGAFA